MFTIAPHTDAEFAQISHRERACDASALAQIANLTEANHRRAMRREELRRLEAEGRYSVDDIRAEMNENLVKAVETERKIAALEAAIYSPEAQERVQTVDAVAFGKAATRTGFHLRTHARRERRLASRKAAEKAAGAAKRAARDSAADR